MMLSSMFTKMLGRGGGRDKGAMNKVLGQGWTTGWGFPLPFFCKGGQEGWRREATRQGKKTRTQLSFYRNQLQESKASISQN